MNANEREWNKEPEELGFTQPGRVLKDEHTAAEENCGPQHIRVYLRSFEVKFCLHTAKFRIT
jgi:hypothetical protein